MPILVHSASHSSMEWVVSTIVGAATATVAAGATGANGVVDTVAA